MTLHVFLACCTQWIVGGMGGFIGLHYSSVETVMRRMHIPEEEQDEVFFGVQEMERAAAREMNQQQLEKAKNHGR